MVPSWVWMVAEPMSTACCWRSSPSPAAEFARALAGYYAGQSQITVHPLGEVPGFLAANQMAGTDRLEIYGSASPDGSQLLLAAVFDNLGKGASGAAVQCMNLMLGLPETAGLE